MPDQQPATPSAAGRKQAARSITDDMRELQQELASIEVRVTSREADAIDRLRMDLDVSRTETAKARQAATESEQELNRVREAIAQRDLQIKQLQITVAAKDKIIDTIEQGCTELRAEFARVEGAHKSEVQNFKDEVRCRDEMLEVLKAQLEQLKEGLPSHREHTQRQQHEDEQQAPAAAATDMTAFHRLDEGSLAQLQRERHHPQQRGASATDDAAHAYAYAGHEDAAMFHPHYAAPLETTAAATTTKKSAPRSARSKSAGAVSSASMRSGSPPSLAPDTIAMLNELWSKLDAEKRAPIRKPRTAAPSSTAVSRSRQQAPMRFGKENAPRGSKMPSANGRSKHGGANTAVPVPQPLSGRVSRTALGPKRPEWQS